MAKVAILAALSIFLFTATSFGQPKRLAYYDALVLDSLNDSIAKNPTDTTTLKAYLDTLWQYTGNEKLMGTRALLNKFVDNPFLYEDVKRAVDKYDLVKKKIGSGRSTPSPLVGTTPNAISNSTVSGSLPWQANLVAGVTEYLAEGFQNTLSQYFLDALKDSLQNNKKFQYLFPSTSAMLRIDQSESAYGTMFQLLKTSVQTDIQNMPENLNQFINNVSPFDSLINSSASLQLLSDMLSFFDQIQSGQNPADILSRISEFRVVQGSKNTTVVGLIKIFASVSNALRKKSGKRHTWISWPEVSQLSKSQARYLYGLVFQTAKDIPLVKWNGRAYTLGDVVKVSSSGQNATASRVETAWETFQGTFLQIAGVIEQAKAESDSVRAKGAAPLTIYLTYADASLQVFEYAINLRLINVFPGVIGVKSTDPKFKTLENSVSRYRLIAFHVRQLLDQLQQKQYAAVMSNSLAVISLCDTSFKSEKFFRDVAFLTAIAEAKNSEDVKSAIEAASLPVGSYSIKRKAVFDVSLNSYVGLGGGVDSKGFNLKYRASGGLIAPVGISFSWGSGCIPVTVHLNLLDFGVPLYASVADTNGIPSNLQLVNLLSPGLGVIVHFKTAPFSIGALWTYTPDILSLTNSLGRQSAFRIQIMATVDIPILDIYVSQQ